MSTKYIRSKVNHTLFNLYGDLVAKDSQKQGVKEVINSNYAEERSFLTSVYSEERGKDAL